VTIDTTISTDGCCSSCKNKPERHTGLESYDAAVPQNKFKFKIGRKKFNKNFKIKFSKICSTIFSVLARRSRELEKNCGRSSNLKKV